MFIQRVELTDFRNYQHETIELTRGVTAIVGNNAQGKTSLAEAMSYLATLESFRGDANEFLIRVGADIAYIRAWILHDDGREVLVEAEINRAGRNRVLVNKQRLNRVRDMLGIVRTTIFSPEDLDIVYAGPAIRRKLMDDALVAMTPRMDSVRLEIDRIIRQRNMLLKQCGGRLNDETQMTLEVWDEKLAGVGTEMGEARARLVAQLTPHVIEAYELLAGEPTRIDVIYEPSWRNTGLANALVAARTDDLRRAVSTVGPHRDDLELAIKGMPARNTASQGECRTLSLAMRLGIHRLITDHIGQAPLLVLDDVLSELDPLRCTALLRHLPPGQVIITSASPLPAEAHPDRILTISGGTVVSNVASGGTDG